MSDEERVGPAPAEPTPGELLQQQRQRSGLTLERAAQDLHLDTWVIEAIETNRFSALGAPVFAKGHLRKYAAMLGVPPEEVLRRYERIADGLDDPSLIPAAHGTVREPGGGMSRWLLIALALAIVAGLAGWWVLAPDVDRRGAGAERESAGEATAIPTGGPASNEIRRRSPPVTPLPEVLHSETPAPRPAASAPDASIVEEAPDGADPGE